MVEGNEQEDAILEAAWVLQNDWVVQVASARSAA